MLHDQVIAFLEATVVFLLLTNTVLAITTGWALRLARGRTAPSVATISGPTAGQRRQIVVNGLKVAREFDVITYDAIRALALMTGAPSVTFHKADQDPNSGTMWPGCAPVRVKDGTVFNCVHTGKA